MEVLLMGILRKYLWLVLPIVFFANYASADTCENDPYACTPAKLCSKTTEKINNVLYWISSEEDKHLKVARKINLNCDAKDAMSSCQKDASVCSILELCEVAVTKEVSATNWNEINPQHVKLAKSFGLDCGVSPSAVSNTSTSPCDENPSACISEALCEKATHDGFGKKEWRTGYYKNYVKEAKQRGLTCGVKSTSIDKTCSQDVLKCTPTELCEAATYKTNEITDWKVGAYKKYVKEAKRRNISCGVNIRAKNDKTCKQDLLKCTSAVLCEIATYNINGITGWKEGNYIKFVDEAKRRNISCGVSPKSNDEYEKARIARKAENKRKADEKARLALEAEKKRKADEKARIVRIALEAKKKRKDDEKKRLALEAEKKNKPSYPENCNEMHDALAVGARDLFGEKNISKDNWAACHRDILVFKPLRTGTGIAWTETYDFRGFVYSRDNRNLFFYQNGGVMCYDVGLNVLKRGRGRGCD